MSLDYHGQHVRTFSSHLGWRGRLVRTIDTSRGEPENNFPTVYHIFIGGKYRRPQIQIRIPWIVWEMFS